MINKLTVRNFKRFGKVEIELGNPVVFIGPNNSGKTSALQSLALWEIGLKRWNEKRKGKTTPEKRPAVTINRRDLIAVPIPNSKLLWHNLHVRDVMKSEKGKINKTKNVRVEIIVEGFIEKENKTWECGLEFDYANEEAFYCRPLGKTKKGRMPIPDEAGKIEVAFLPPMSGLATNETKLDDGAINVRIGEGRTAEVLRNLCYKISEDYPEKWSNLSKHIEELFGAKIERPEYIPERGEISMTYIERDTKLDLSSSGRGLQQTLLLLAYMYTHPKAVLLLDEPDAHLEILRQRQIYQILTDVALQNNNQIIAASHSEVLLNEAAGRDVVVAFLGKPHWINRGSQVLKSLKEIGFEDYYQAEQTGWVLYLEGSTDLAILRSFARTLGYNESIKTLERPFVHYVGNQPIKVKDHFYAIREAVPRLKGIAIFDKLELTLPPDMGTQCIMWKRREIENYFCSQEILENYAQGKILSEEPLFAQAESQKNLEVMRESIKEISKSLEKIHGISPWDNETKVSDDFLTPLFKEYYKRLDLPNIMAKKDFHELARLVPKEKVDDEIKSALKQIVKVAKTANPSELSE